MAPRIVALAAVGSLAVALAGCAHEKTAQGGYRWVYMPGGAEDTRLAYGIPNSDDLVLLISCRPGARQLDVTAVGLAGDEIALASGRAESRLAAARIQDELNEGGVLQARATASEAALAGFRKSGGLTLLAGGERHSLTAAAADRGDVRAFFRACEA